MWALHILRLLISPTGSQRSLDICWLALSQCSEQASRCDTVTSCRNANKSRPYAIVPTRAIQDIFQLLQSSLLLMNAAVRTLIHNTLIHNGIQYKELQHSALESTLRSYGYEVTVLTYILGFHGSTYISSMKTLRTLSIERAAMEKFSRRTHEQCDLRTQSQQDSKVFRKLHT